METSAIYFVKLLLLPPSGLLLAAFIGLSLRRRKIGLPLVAFSLALLTGLCLPAVAKRLAGSLETLPILKPDALGQFAPQAIVVIGGGAAKGGEYNGSSTVNERTLVRLRYAAKLAREFKLPVLVSGGAPDTTKRPEAQLMAEVLAQEFNVPAKWQEAASVNTAENAQLSRKLLQPQAIDRIVLVTQAYHLPRAVSEFSKAGFQVLPAPTDFISHSSGVTLLDFIPSASGLTGSFLVLHEYLGLLWYRIRY
jgi:uncharacterized SAM-binding protein YcdF (DUF218 family)